MEAINYIPGGKNMILSEDAQMVQGVSGNGCYLPIGTGTIALAGDRNELSVSLWRQWDGVVEQDAERGVFSFKNIQGFFDRSTDLLTIVINGFKAITDIKDDQKQAHWCFTFAKNNRFTVYKDAKAVYELLAGDKPVDMAEGFILGGGKTHATFDEVRLYKTVLTQGEINGLFYLVSKGTQIKQLESLVQGYTPKYLGVAETVPTTRTAIITKGERLGAQDANAGDWVLMAQTSGGWKCGVCYRWTGTLWVNLEPEANYVEQYHACLLHICEIPELMKNTGHFGALFAKVIVAQEAFIKKLAADQAFLKELIVQRLRIDSDKNSDTDFEAWFDKDNGLKIKNKGEEIFKVDPNGNIDAVCFTISSAMLADKDIQIEPNKNITQKDLKPGQKMFYNGLEVERVTCVSSSYPRVDSVRLSHDFRSRGSRMRYKVSTFFYTLFIDTYTIYFKNGTSRTDVRKVYLLSTYGENTEELSGTGGIYDMPYHPRRDYPNSKEEGGCAPGNIIIKGVEKQRRIITFKNLPTQDDDISSLPIGALYMKKTGEEWLSSDVWLPVYSLCVKQ